MTKMKVLFMARRFPPSVGGMERFAFDLSCALEQQVELIKITWGGSNKWLPIVLPSFFLRAFWRLMIDRSIEVIHVQDGVQAPMGWLLSRIFHKPYIVVAHGLDITYEALGYQRIILPFVRRASHVVSISRATNDEALSRGVLEDRASVITLGTHDDYGTPVSDKVQLSKALGMDLVDSRLLLTTGRLVKRKGVEWFVRNVLPAIAEREKNVTYLIVGDGAEKDAITRAVQETGLQQQVKLLGRVDDKTRSLLYQSSDIFVMPNIIVPGDMEGFGIVAHEAATAELAVVASNIEGIRDALDNQKNGVLVKSEDSSAFADTIIRFLKNENERKSFGKAARQYTLKKYDWHSIAKQYLDVYNRIK